MLPIWEGTTNICSLDVLRAVQKTQGEVITAFISHCQSVLEQCGDCPSVHTLLSTLHQFEVYMANSFQQSASKELRCRELAFSIANIYIGWFIKNVCSSNRSYELVRSICYNYFQYIIRNNTIKIFTIFLNSLY